MAILAASALASGGNGFEGKPQERARLKIDADWHDRAGLVRDWPSTSVMDETATHKVAPM